MHEARLYQKLDQNKVLCNLCAHHCLIAPDSRGRCGVRENKGGTLYSLIYGKVIASHDDPIEKKPFFHFLPGTRAYSIATVGCNFSCLNCQNSDISQAPVEKYFTYGELTEPETVVELALEKNCRSIAYTYTEPTIFFEFAYDIARSAHKNDRKNLFVTNGYMTPEMLDEFNPFLDAANVDLKSFDDDFYQKVCGARLRPVLESLVKMRQLGIWLEITTLLIPEMNDGEAELKNLAGFIYNQLGPETPWHISGFHPSYKMEKSRPTPLGTLTRAREIGLAAGLKYVYIGNFPGVSGENTSCPRCARTIVKRNGFKVLDQRITEGRCDFCRQEIAGVWK